MQGLEAMFALRAAAQQVDYALNGWMADTAGSFAGYQILMALWATAGKGITQRDRRCYAGNARHCLWADGRP